jgi:hypothetical protein
MPKRIQRKRTRGYKLPPNTVCVTRPSKWGNPFRVGDTCGAVVITNAQMAVDLHRDMVLDIFCAYDFRLRLRKELRGKNLACWCKVGTPCHADILLRIANS